MKNIFLLIFIFGFMVTQASAARQKRQVGCSPPSYLMTSKNYADTDGSLKVRCKGGQIFNMTDSPQETVGCEEDPWPSENACIPGLACPISNIPEHAGINPLLPDDISEELASGESIKYACSNMSQALKKELRDLAVECFNGNWYHLSTEPPEDEDACINPQSCKVSDFTEFVNHMEKDGSRNEIQHGSSLDFKCKENRTLDQAKDSDGDELFNVLCYDGQFERDQSWPDIEECRATCDALPENVDFTELGFESPSGDVSTLSGSFLNLTCSDAETFATDLWTSNVFSLECLHTGQFKTYDPWPTCMEKQSCGYPPKFPVNSALRTPNVSIDVPDSAVFQCRDSDMVTDLGPSISVQCMIQPGYSNASFVYPEGWGTESSKCRKPIKCKAPFEAPLTSGLQLEVRNTSYYEFEYATYKCKNPSQILWRHQKKMTSSSTQFRVQCGLGGQFQLPPDGWPICDDETPDTCANYPEPPDIIEFVKKMPQFPGGKVLYKCKEPGFISNIGALIEVTCERNLDGTLEFALPNGWNNLKCRSAVYPDFRQDPCVCPGDADVTTEQHKEILEICYDEEEPQIHSSMNVPLKKRCGVGTLSNITKENICYCTERKNAAADFQIWSKVELSNFYFHANFTEPTTSEFKRAKRLIESEFDRRLIDASEDTAWRYVRTKIITFTPASVQGCSLENLPEISEDSGLTLKTTKSVEFGDYAEYFCSNDTVTDDGYEFKLLCLPNGRFQKRNMGLAKCRERETCTKSPPRPPEEYGLARNYSRNIKEFGFASYSCINDNEFVEGTEDGNFHVMCKKRGIWPQAEGKYGVDWATCKTRPSNEDICQNLPLAPDGYVDDFIRTLYVEAGTQIAFKCEQDGFLAGDAEKLYYKCVKTLLNGTDVYTFQADGHSEDDIPGCREPKSCPTLTFPVPDPDSGLRRPLQAEDIFELQHVNYSCIEKGSTWSLAGEYKPLLDFEFDDNVQIIDGKLRINCALGGLMGKVTKWPKCRDSSVQNCQLSDDNPKLPSDDLMVVPVDQSQLANDALPIGAKVQVQCKMPENVTEGALPPITDSFVDLKLTCDFDGKITFPSDLNVTECRSRLQCGSSPTPPETSKLEISGTDTRQEHQPQKYVCVTGYTLKGVRHQLVNSNFEVDLPCVTKDITDTDEDGNVNFLPPTEWSEPLEWPQCLEIVDSCTELPDIGAEFVNTTALPIDVGQALTFKCVDSTRVTYLGKEFSLTCTESGQFQLLEDMPYCRAPLSCPDAPVPSEGTFLQPSFSNQVKEWSHAHYQCQAGSKIPEAFDESQLINGNFSVLCGSLGKYPETIDWPTCEITHCVNISQVENFNVNVTDGDYVPVGGKIQYSCADEGQVVDNTSVSLVSTCLANGELTPIENWPNCRTALACSNWPIPDQSTTHLLPTTSENVLEFDYAYYECQQGASLTDDPELNIVDGKFKLICGANGVIEAEPNWPTCVVDSCHQLVTQQGFVNASSLPVDVGQSVAYKCADESKVMDQGLTINLACLDSGNLQIPESWPSCRLAKLCTNIPQPPASSKLEPTQSTSVSEFRTAIYNCKADGRYNIEANSLNEFHMQCPTSGAFPESSDIQWPECIIENCIEIPTLAGFTKVTNEAVPVGNYAYYQCDTAGHVSDNGLYQKLQCQSDGSFDQSVIDTWPACRPPVDCQAASPPTPPESSKLQPSESSVTLEFQVATYLCQDFFAMDNYPNGFPVQCGLTGLYPDPINWPTCMPSHCPLDQSGAPEITGFKTDTTDSVSVGSSILYTCETDGQVTDTARHHPFIQCQEDGTLSSAPDSLPTCRDAFVCGVPPDPPEGTNLELVTSTDIKEYESARYSCKQGYDFDPTSQGVQTSVQGDSTFSILCRNENSFNLTTEDWTATCLLTETRRRKRWIAYEGLKTDIKYSLNVIFETQWMYTDDMRDDIFQATFPDNVTFADVLYPKAMIDVFHERIESVLVENMGSLQLKHPISPTCEQPMTPYSPAKCTNGLVTPNCQTELLESPWLKSLGFTYAKQAPQWLANQSAHHLAVGAGVEFYCENTQARPKKDKWDKDGEDGIITAHCSHNGQLSIPMTPSSWDRCRMLCPVKKPKPPLAPGAQLISFSTEKDDIELWEDDFIVYGCQNESLVIDNTKGVTSVNYKCLDDGTYNTPRGIEEGDPWPECTLKPVDPLIIDAIVLLTGKFDRNLIYEQVLTNTTDTEPDTLSMTVAIIGITVPTIGAIVAFIFLCMCFTRADSPICKIFEPQA